MEELELGIRRDVLLGASNNYALFMEEFASVVDIGVRLMYDARMTTDALDTSKVLYDEAVEFLRSLTTADQTPIISGDQPEDVAFALVTNVALLERLAAYYSGGTYEYCVMHPDYPDAPHRGPFLFKEPADRWVQDTVGPAGSPDRGFYVARRTVGSWERVA